MRRWFGSKRVRLIAMATAVLLAMGTGVTVWLLQRGEPDRRTAWEQIMSMAEDDGTVGLEMAKKAFVLSYVPLPGVTEPDGREGPARSGTPAANWILGHWDELTTEEQEIVADALGLEWSPSQAGALRLTSLFGPKTPSNCKPDSTFQRHDAPGEYLQLVYETVPVIEALIGVTLNATLTVCVTDNQVDNAFAATGTQLDPDGSMRCRVNVYPKGQQETGESLRSIIVHELMHCFNRRAAAQRVDSNGYISIPPWIDEGLCNWVAYKIAGPVPNLDDWWTTYLNSPQQLLVKRSYDAFGFFQHIDNVRGDMQHSVQRTAAAVGDDWSLAAFLAVTESNRRDVLSSHPSSWANKPGWGVPAGGADAWFLNGPGLSAIGPPLVTHSLQNDKDPVSVMVPRYGSGLVEVVLSADVFMVRRSQHAWGRFSPEAATDWDLTAATSEIFCAKSGGCKCPDGYVPTVPFTNVPNSIAYLAVTGGNEPAQAEMTGYSIDRFCKEQPQPQTPPLDDPPDGGPIVDEDGGCLANCGGSDRDPHLNTFDRLFYDLQSVGEYTLVAATDDDLEAQTRTGPVAGSTTASFNVAIALRVNGDRVGFYLKPGAIELRINGEPVAGPQPLSGGGTITDAQGTYTVIWPDGTKAWIFRVAESLTFQMEPAESRNGKLTGPLGDYDGDLTNDLRLRDGTVLTNPSFEQLHTTFVDSWRVTDASSLFDYGPGESTETFTDLAFPSGPVTAANAPNRVAAEAACRAAGVTDPVQLANCIIDVGVTGDDAYAAAAANMQRFLARVLGPGETAYDGVLAGGEIKTTGQKDRFPLDLGGATVFFVADWTGPSLGCDQALSISVIDVTYDHRPCTDGTVRFRVADPGGSYQLEIAGVGEQTGKYQFQVITQKQRDFELALGGTAAGRIDVPGRADAYAFQPPASGKVTFAPAHDCQVSPIWFELVDLTTGVEERSPRSLCFDEPMTVDNPSHRYAIVVTNGDLTTGEYSFRLQAG